MRVRNAVLADLPTLAAIERRSFPDPWPAELLAAYFGDPRALILVAEDPEIVGFLIAREESALWGSRTLHIHDLAVDPNHRRRGAGSALLAELIAVASGRGVPRIRLEVRVTNEGARRFYNAHGFRPVRRLPCYYEDGGPALRMELDLRRATGGTPGRGRTRRT